MNKKRLYLLALTLIFTSSDASNSISHTKHIDNYAGRINFLKDLEDRILKILKKQPKLYMNEIEKSHKSIIKKNEFFRKNLQQIADPCRKELIALINTYVNSFKVPPTTIIDLLNKYDMYLLIDGSPLSIKYDENKIYFYYESSDILADPTKDSARI